MILLDFFIYSRILLNFSDDFHEEPALLWQNSNRIKEERKHET